MAITQQQIQTCKAIQDAAAHDLNPTVRLVAGPGTGKSFVIEERVYWLLSNQNVTANSIIAISFTRAAAKDLKERITSFCLGRNEQNVSDVRVSTLHSLALYILRQTGNLALYPTDPMIMDDWELSEIFDAEFSSEAGITPTRSSQIRRDHEAFWSTGNFNPANAPVINNPITQAERNSFTAFYSPRMQTYSCVLPGEMVRMCVSQIQAGHIDPVAVLGIEHLIVDEVQDLNPCDFEFIDELIQRGVNVFVAGDDDQSVYSFRYAFPQGIQNFTQQYPGSTNHVLNDCFRCTTDILAAASNVISNFQAPGRIQKNMSSLYSTANPTNAGFVQTNIFNTATQEARYIANSCAGLINNNVQAKDIMILLNNKRALLNTITAALDAAHVPYDAYMRDDFKDTNHGRFVLSLLRILGNNHDYVAHRVLLGTPRGIGLTTCKSITDKTLSNNINYRNIFYNQLPNGVFTPREVRCIDKSKANINEIQNWSLEDTLNVRNEDIRNIILQNFSQGEVDNWNNFIGALPIEMTLEELKEFLQTDSEEEKDNLLAEVRQRANPNTEEEVQQPVNRVRVLSFHSSKGLSAKVVFIPGLEETVFPNSASIAVAGLILENARLLYVAITRARATCILSYCRRRNMYGLNTNMVPSRFCQATGRVFLQQNDTALSNNDIQTISTCIANL